MLQSSIIETYKARLEELIVETGAFRYSPDKPFQLASGRVSPYYFDLKKLNGHPEGLDTVARIFYHIIKGMKNVTSVGGLESGSISIASAISHLSFTENQKDPTNPLINSFYVRKEAKKYGSGKQIEGNIKSPVVVVDDVITSGDSAIQAVNVVKDQKYNCECLISIVFRGTEENHRNITNVSKFEYLFTEKELVEKFTKDTL
ncbi:MAG: orotate phosphoribosyltransferase [Nitrosopumilales archaeon CG_4_9_14_0_2_um_filter_34_16]|nr:MAG: orotate phosphoribosyltransferase [Nitrosopumilales archaeon CG_4_9_14_0_2_um_filter_34_16]